VAIDMTLASAYGLSSAKRLVALALAVTSCGCVSRSVSCTVIRPLRLNSSRVVESYRSWPWRERCNESTPRQIQIDASAFRIRLELVADEDPQIVFGIVSTDGNQYAIEGEAIKTLLPGTVYRTWATVFTQLSRLPNRSLVFAIRNTTTGRVAASYSTSFDVVTCSCSRYDVP